MRAGWREQEQAIWLAFALDSVRFVEVARGEPKENHSMPADFSPDILEGQYPEAVVKLQFETAVDWGRFAELYEYNSAEHRLYLPEIPSA